MPKETKPPKGYKTWSGDVEGYGTIRVNVPSNITDPQVVQQHLNAEADRRDIVGKQKEESKGVVQPKTEAEYPGTEGRLPMRYASDVVTGIPSAAGRLFEGSGHPFTYEEFEQNPMTLEQMPIVQAIQGNMPPEQGSDMALNLILMALGGKFGENQGPTRFRTGLSRAMQAPGASKIGGAIGSSAGSLAGAEMAKTMGLPPYYGLYPGGAVGGLAGAKLPSMVRAFRAGYGEPIPRPAASYTPPIRTPASSVYGMPPALPGPSVGPIVTPPPAAGTPPAALGPGFTERLQNLKEATKGKEFSQLPPDEPITPKETPTEETPAEPKGKVTLSSAKRAAKTHNMSIEETVKQLQDSGYEVSRSPKIRRK